MSIAHQLTAPFAVWHSHLYSTCSPECHTSTRAKVATAWEAYSRDQSLREGSVCMLTAVCLLADRASSIKRRAKNTKTPERTRPSSQDNNGMSKLLQFPSFDFSSLFTATTGTENGQRPRSLDAKYARKVRPSPATRASMLSCVLHRAFDACMIVRMAIGCMDVVHAKSAWLTGKAVSSGENTSRCEGS